MKPLPVQNPSLIQAIDNAALAYLKSNRRAATCPTQRIYPWLLFASTAVAALFCLMYITKPVILASQSPIPTYTPPPATAAPKTTAAPVNVALMPANDQLPGEKTTKDTAPDRTSSPAAAFEQTNLRIQHILTAEAPGGHLAKIDIDVPVLYRSRNLRWTAAEVADARALLVRLADYQEKSRTLRADGAELLDSWNRLVERSIPASDLRADSPTLPANQQDAADAPRPAGLDTTELIKIQPSGK
jgi:hypothetical protein